jgi:hypothetical protein
MPALPFLPVLLQNEYVNPKTLFALLALLLAPGIASGQSFADSLAKSLTVHGPFDPTTYKPLSGSERWQRWVNSDGRSVSMHADAFASAAYSQVFNSPAEWGRTPRGFGRRLGSDYASEIIQNSVHDSMAAVAGTDTRYFACDCTGLFPRTGHALKMTLLTYTSSGHLTVDIPQLSGAYGSSMIEKMWYPPHYSPLVQGVQSGHIEVGILGAEHILQEFSPELKRIFHLRFLIHSATP